ncbi:hypothetical protein OESDEN_25018, partial [Oesophagostomum dentatum]
MPSAEKVEDSHAANPQILAGSSEDFFSTPNGRPAAPASKVKSTEPNKTMGNNNPNCQPPGASSDDDYFNIKGRGGLGQAPNYGPSADNKMMGAYNQNQQNGFMNENVFKPNANFKNEGGFGGAPNVRRPPENKPFGAFGQNRPGGMSNEDMFKPK